jgi:hypothetical protein
MYINKKVSQQKCFLRLQLAWSANCNNGLLYNTLKYPSINCLRKKATSKPDSKVAQCDTVW